MKLQRVRHNLVTGQQQQQQYLLVGDWLITPKCYECGKAFIRSVSQELPGNSVVRNPPANAGDTGLSPDLGRSYMPQSN